MYSTVCVAFGYSRLDNASEALHMHSRLAGVAGPVGVAGLQRRPSGQPGRYQLNASGYHSKRVPTAIQSRAGAVNLAGVS